MVNRMATRFSSVVVVVMLMAAIPVGAAILISSHSTNAPSNSQGHGISPQSHHYTYSDLIYLINHRGSGFNGTSRADATSAYSSSHTGPLGSYSPSFSSSDSVTFLETGLPSNVTWFVSVDGQNHTTNGTYQNIVLPSGTYSYKIGAYSGYISRSPSGTFSLPASGLSIASVFQSSLSVQSTLFLGNGTVAKGNYVTHNSSNSPIGILSDPANNCTYVADSSTNTVYIIDSAGKIAGRINVGSSPSQILYDSSNGFKYVSNSGSNNLSVIGKNNTVVGSIGVGNFPFGLAYDPSNNYIYVANLFSSSITILKPSQSGLAATVATISLPSSFNPFFAVYDKSTASIYVSNVNGNQIAVVNGVNFQGYLNVMGSPAMMAYDTSNGNLYVADAQTSASTGYGYISVIDSNGRVTANYSIPGSVNPFGVSYDPNRDLIYVSDANSNQIFVFNPQNHQFINDIQVGSEPYGISISPSGNLVEISNFDSGSISYLEYLGAVKAVTFKEVGLSPGTSWSIRLGNVSLTSNTGTITFNETPGAYSFYPAAVPGYELSSMPSAVAVSSQNVSVTINYEKLYGVSVIESGLPSGNVWGFTLNGNHYTTSAGAINLKLVNGSYNITPDSVAGYFIPASKQVIVSGSGTDVYLYYRTAYTLTFDESGLMPGQSWSVNVNGTIFTSSISTITVMLPNGTYSYYVNNVQGYELQPTAGSATINGSPVQIGISFVKLYTVMFVEHGISPGSQWNVTLGGRLISSSTGTISFLAANGTYSFNASAPLDYIPPYRSGSVSVSGSNEQVNLYFTKDFKVAFAESGLPQGADWWVSIGGHNITSDSSMIALNLTNGSYSYSASKIFGYVLENGTGSIDVNGASVTVYLNYWKLYQATFQETGLPAGTAWYVNITGKAPIEETSAYATVNLTNGTYSYSVATTDKSYSAAGGFLTVDGSGVSEQISFIPVEYKITFSENGLPAGVAWYLNISNGHDYRSTSSGITLSLMNGTYSYAISTSDKEYSPASNSGSLSVIGKQASVVVQFKPVYYSVQFVESGLPSGTVWYVNITGGQSYSSSTPVIGAELTNGSYSYEIGVQNRTYSSPGGSFAVGGSSIGVKVNFKPVEYTISFNEAGLPAGSTWVLVFNGSEYLVSGSQEQFSSTNGTYGYSAYFEGNYAANPARGNVTVSGSNVTVTIQFQENSTQLSFYQNGVPDGTTWHLNFNGMAYSSSGNSIVLNSGQGSFSYSANYTLYGQNIVVYGNLTVSGTAMNITVNFPALYKITFYETGLSDGAQWGIVINGYNITTHNGEFSILLPNGTYNFSVHDSSNQSYRELITYGDSRTGDYTASTMVSAGSANNNNGSQPLMVNGQNVKVEVHFNEATSHKSHHHGNWKDDLKSTADAIVGYVVYIEEVVQLAAEHIMVYIRVLVVLSMPAMSYALFPVR